MKVTPFGVGDVDESLPTITTCECTVRSAAALHTRLGKVTAQYQYRHPIDTHVVFSRFRHEPPGEDKTFRYCPCYRKNRPEHASLLLGAHRVLQGVTDQVPVFHLTEGCKDSIAIHTRLHQHATTSHMGTTFTVEMAEPFRGYEGDFIVHVDKDHENPEHVKALAEGRDMPGARAALNKYRALLAVGIQAEQIIFVEAKVGKDAHDHLEAGYGEDDFVDVHLRDLKLRAPKTAGRKTAQKLQLSAEDLPEGPAMGRFVAALEAKGFFIEPLANGEYKTSCPNPAHSDGNPSFDFGQGDAGVKGICRSRDCEEETWCEGLELKKNDLRDKPQIKKPVGVDVTNSSVAREWLLDAIGKDKLAGFLMRRGGIIHTPREGEKGYVPLTKSEHDSDGPAQVRAATPEYIAARVDVTYDCYKLKMDRDGTVKCDDDGNPYTQPALFPESAAKRVVQAADMAPNLRWNNGIVHAPVFRPDGTLVEKPGYDDATGLLYLPEAGLTIQKVSTEPTIQEVRAALAVVMTPIKEFPFVTAHDKANFLGAILTPLLRTILPPPYKFVLIEAHQPGSGKTFLAEIIRTVFGGVFRSEFPEEEAEVRKQTTSILSMTTGPVVVLDNISGKLRSSTFSGLLTSIDWDDRSLGSNKMIQCVNDRLWIGTGNNVSLGGDLPRRTVRVRIDPKRPSPERRTGFVIQDPVRWTREHRAEMIHALLTIIRGWIASGMPAAARTSSDGYAAWTQGINGILSYAGIKGVFDHEVTNIQVGTDDDDWGAFYTAVYGLFGDKAWTTSSVLGKVDPMKRSASDLVGSDFLSADVLPEELSAEYDSKGADSLSLRQKLGKRLSNRDGRWSGEFCVRVEGAKTKKFRIVKHTN
ncbi:hypothetical protein NJL88_11580 [Streptomyces sp. DK15]|uniref:hypothetical protein n=1 Tax=Streptomyces sp. DK15 TaxID=2957499 RepID=UPI0029B6426C|nr:hypothetical protein [Streptomyces sp. DK15]MDX2390694.1 hypothetical protein [Streptomyces sp. DK15]